MSVPQEQPLPSLDTVVHDICVFLQHQLSFFSQKEINWERMNLKGWDNMESEHLWLPEDAVHPLTQRPARDFLVRVGNLFYLRHTLPSKLPREYLQTMPNIILMHDFASALVTKSLTPYAIVTLAAMQTVDFHGKTVLDVGSADGALSLAALALGAERVVGVDNASGYITPFQEHRKQNMHSKEQLSFLHADITGPSFMQTLSEVIPLETIDIVLSNIGPQEIYGRETYLGGIDLLQHLPQTETYVGGGFAHRCKLQPRTAIRELKPKGFTIRAQYKAGTVTAFTAQKTPKIYL